MACEEFLWRLRCALHALTGRHDDRLLLDHQRTLAERLGYCDGDGRMAVEYLMHDYYRRVMALSRLNEMLLQLFEEEILYRNAAAEPRPLTQHFQSRNGFLEVVNPPLFTYRPFSLLEVYLLLAQHPDLKGVRASTLRLIRAHLHLIDERFRHDRRAHDYFTQLLRQPQGVTHALRRMHRHGVLAAYLPAFARIEGQMQFDLFHTYTVDQHTLFVLRNTRRLFSHESASELPLASQVARSLPKPELLHIAALFHDIAKGRGGDHSTLGEVEVSDFAARHGLGAWDQRLVAWLVRNHLAMSSTAQRRDIDDPAVIHEFALLVGEQVRLDYLYLLTVCDIRATNPQLWNSWRESLLRGLYQSTKRALRRGLGNPIDREEQVAQIRTAALAQLEADQLDSKQIERVWEEFDDDYFMRHTPSEVAWHTALIAGRKRLPVVALRHEHERGSTAIFIHADQSQYLFGHTTALLEQLGLSVVDARIIQSAQGRTLDTYLVMEGEGEPIEPGYRSEEIRDALERRLSDPERPLSPPERCLPRRHKHIPVTTEIHLHYDPRRHCTALELYTRDRPGLLSRIALAFACSSVRLLNAKIGTFGSHVEDLFYITDQQRQPIGDGETGERLIASLHHFIEGEGCGETGQQSAIRSQTP
jgi:[protein-PII] uridylyltransferase